MVKADAFMPAEIDAIEQMGDALVVEDAGLGVSDKDTDIRVTKVAWLKRGVRTEPIYNRIMTLVRQLNAHSYRFDIADLEIIQYTVYHGEQGGHYDWHIDQNKDSPNPRKISVSIQLSDPANYEGCDLQFQDGSQILTAPRERGTAIAFPSFCLHRVTPITSGTRKSLVVWVTGPDFR
jgi:PKHD-type hydroxylase